MDYEEQEDEMRYRNAMYSINDENYERYEEDVREHRLFDYDYEEYEDNE
jgi:hypothetical protein